MASCARSAAEIAQIFPVIAGPDSWDAATLQARQAHDEAPQYNNRIAALGDVTLKALAEIHPLDPDIDDAFSDACAVFRQAGAEIIEIELPTLPHAVETIVTFFSAELACANAKTLAKRKADYNPAVAEMIETGLAIPADQLEQALRTRSQLRQEIISAFAFADAHFLLTPTTPRPAMPLSQLDPSKELATLIPFTCGFNLTGNPAISLPCGLTRDGLPIGLQIVSRHLTDAALLELAQQYQRLTNWHERYPHL